MVCAKTTDTQIHNDTFYLSKPVDVVSNENGSTAANAVFSNNIFQVTTGDAAYINAARCCTRPERPGTDWPGHANSKPAGKVLARVKVEWDRGLDPRRLMSLPCIDQHHENTGI